MLRNLFLCLNILVAIGLAITYITPYIDPIDHKKLPILGLFYPLLLLANMGFLMAWLFTSKIHYALLSFLTIFFGIQHISSILNIPYQNEKPYANENVIRLGSYNIKNFDYIAWKDNSFQPVAIRKLQEQFKDLDIICLQESDYNTDQLFEKKLQFPHNQWHHGTRIFSRSPLLKKGHIPFESRKNSCTWADIKVGKEVVRIYNLHLESNMISYATDRVVERNGMGWKNRIRMTLDMLRSYSFRSRKRAEQTQLVLAHIQKSPHPVIVCGDFNDSPLSFIYRKFSSILKDGFIEKGNGFSFSYRGKIPFLRIDYIFSSPTLRFQKYQTDRSLKYSDHYPVLATVALE